MRATVVGPLLDHQAACHFTQRVATATPGGSVGFTVETRHHFTHAPVELRAAQPSELPVNYRHRGRPVGEVLHLERDGNGSVWALAEVDALSVPMTALYWSAELASDEELSGAALTPDPAEVGLTPVRMFPGGLQDQDERRRLRLRKGDPFLSALISRAIEATRRRRRGDPLMVRDGRRHEVKRMGPGAVLADGELVGGQQRGGPVVRDDGGRPVGPLEYRPGRILSVG